MRNATTSSRRLACLRSPFGQAIALVLGAGGTTTMAGNDCPLPTLNGGSVTIHASVVDPTHLAFAGDSALFCGRDALGSGGENDTPVKIHRIPAGAGVGVEFGAAAINDPDAVLVDALGRFAQPGAVIVGGQSGIVDSGVIQGQMQQVLGDGSILPLLPSSNLVNDPQDMTFDGLGRMLIADRIGEAVFRWNPGSAQPSMFIDLQAVLGEALRPKPRFIGFDSQNRPIVSVQLGDPPTSGGIYRCNDGDTAVPLAIGLDVNAPFAVGQGCAWGVDTLYIISDGTLWRVEPTAPLTLVDIGCGFDGEIGGMTFGPDGALYVAEFGKDRVLRVCLPVPRDLDCNGAVDGSDLGALLAEWGTVGGPADLDGAPGVNGGDLGILLAAWGECQM